MKLSKPPEGGFQITQRHYDIILKQGLDLLPIEAGGFLGGDGKTGLVKAIFPIFNQHLEVQTDTFGFTAEDMSRALKFFDEHKLDYFAMYHTHPKGVAYPSQTDIDTGHTFHFILSLRDKDKPDFRSYYIYNKKPIEQEFKVISNTGTSKKDLKNSVPEYDASTQALMKQQDDTQELSEKLDQLKHQGEEGHQSSPYKKNTSFDPNSDFNTLA
ncbi:MAG: Mov34/MPN/PAD-1 family protein [bacterium]